jgi:hypothetical protein
MAARNPALFGFGQYPNLIGLGSALVTVPASYESASLKAIHAQTEEPSELSRILTTNPEFTYWNASFLSLIRSVGGLAVINSNLSPNGYYRFLASDDYAVATPAYQYNPPLAIEASTNISGGVSSVDEAISAPDASFVEPTVTTSSWNARFSFGTPTPTITSGANMAAFVLRMLMVGSDVTSYPGVAAELWESGVLVRKLGTRAVSVSTGDGQLFIFPFNPTELSASDLSNVEVRVAASAGVGTGVYAKLNTVALLTDKTAASGYSHDSGWIASPAQYFVGDEESPVPQLSFDYFPTAEWADDVEGVLLLIMDDQAVASPLDSDTAKSVPIGLIPSAPSGYAQIGIFAAGPALILEHGPQAGAESSIIVEGYEGATEGGQSYGADAFRRRATNVNFTLNRDEKDALLKGIDWQRGKSGPIYVNLDPDLSGQYSEFVSGWVTAAEAGPAIPIAPQRWAADQTMLFTKAYVFEEKL